MKSERRLTMSNDFVSRQWLLNEYDNRHKGPPGGARKMIEEAPAADVRSVVSCCDCKHFQVNVSQSGYLPQGVPEWECRYWCRPTDPTDFCSYGEKREES